MILAEAVVLLIFLALYIAAYRKGARLEALRARKERARLSVARAQTRIQARILSAHRDLDQLRAHPR